MIEELAEFLRSEQSLEVVRQEIPQAYEHLRQLFHPVRDETMANRIRELYDNGNRKVAAVVGLLHVPGLKPRILDLNPMAMTLADYKD